jgi:hypothetical protein
MVEVPIAARRRCGLAAIMVVADAALAAEQSLLASCARQRSGGLRAWSQRAHRYCLEKAIAAREGAAYRAALEALGDGAVRDVRIVEGLE